MPEAEEVGLFLHILGVFALGGATAISLVVFTLARRAKTVQELKHWTGLGAALGKYYVYPIAGLFMLLTGAYLVSKVKPEWDWSDGWVAWSTAALVVAVAVDYFVNAPRLRAVDTAAGPAPDGPVPDAITAQLNDPLLFAGIHGAMTTTVAIMWNMTTHPGGIGALLSIMILAAIGAGSAYPMYRRRQQQ